MANIVEDNTMKQMTGMIIMVMMAGILPALLSGFQPAQPTTYTCPICGETFSSQAELETHFASAHPSEPIEIIWS